MISTICLVYIQGMKNEAKHITHIARTTYIFQSLSSPCLWADSCEVGTPESMSGSWLLYSNTTCTTFNCLILSKPVFDLSAASHPSLYDVRVVRNATVAEIVIERHYRSPPPSTVSPFFNHQVSFAHQFSSHLRLSCSLSLAVEQRRSVMLFIDSVDTTQHKKHQLKSHRTPSNRFIKRKENQTQSHPPYRHVQNYIDTTQGYRRLV